MVRLSKIYTKTGDEGDTMLGSGDFVPKHHARVEAYGSVDEANAEVGLAIEVLRELPGETTSHIAGELESTQHDLFDVGADLCTPIAQGEKDGEKLRVLQHQIDRIEAMIDEHNAKLQPLDSFVLPGGTAASARLHVARTAVRRAERRVAALLAVEPDGTNQLTMVYLNRLSDLLFVLARLANDGGKSDKLWTPGANRE
jgi:cob(I)alamin adenosyltransferase